MSHTRKPSSLLRRTVSQTQCWERRKRSFLVGLLGFGGFKSNYCGMLRLTCVLFHRIVVS